MGKAERLSTRLEKIRWLWFIPSALMYIGTQIPFGKGPALMVSMVFGVAFYLICSRGRPMIICEEIIRDMRSTLEKLGEHEGVFEVKNFSPGLVVRVYLIMASQMVPEFNRALREKIEKSWYKKLVWMTQVVEVEDSYEIKAARRALEESVLNDLRHMIGKPSDKKDKKEEDKK